MPLGPPAPVAEPQWPPRSPHEALLSTPGGRERLRRLAERTSPSPSPARARMSRTTTPALATRSTNVALGMGGGMNDDDGGQYDEEEDEETLQLKLQEIQARLRLKKLQNAKANARPAPAPASGVENVNFRSRPASRVAAPGAKSVPDVALQETVPAVEVPASPVKKAALQQSPKRVQLGIDKGLRAKDVSLKRAPLGAVKRHQDDRGGGPGAKYLQRSRTPGLTSDASNNEAPSRPLSFNERLATARNEEAERQERQERIRKLRTNAFVVGKEEMETYKAQAVDLPDIPERPQTYSRAEILGKSKAVAQDRGGGNAGGYLKRSNTVPTLRSKSGFGGDGNPEQSLDDNTTAITRQQDEKGHEKGQEKDQEKDQRKEEGEEDGSFEPYSGLHLKKRIIPHHVLTRSISGKKVYVLKDFLREVQAPDWSLPDEECDIVLFAVLASKSDPKAHKPVTDSKGKTRESDRGKYMVMTLSDLTHDLELFLFGSGFDRFWKLTPGTVLAVLNPVIMPPPRGRESTGRFGLVINSDCDTILEVGASRDLGYCQATRRDGTPCPAWVNARRTEHCEFHSNEAVAKMRAGRMELNGAGFGFDGRGGGARGGRGRGRGRGGGGGGGGVGGSGDGAGDGAADRRARGYDAETHSRVFVSRSASAASLLDREGEYVDSLGRKDALKRRLAERERERDTARKLGELGAGAGRDYLQKVASKPPVAAPGRKGAGGGGRLGGEASSSSSSSGAGSSALLSSSLSHPPPQLDQDHRRGGAMGPAALDLLSRARNPPKVDLGPVAKRKRPDSSRSNSTVGSAFLPAAKSAAAACGGFSGVGWGASLKDKLGRMKEGAAAFPDGGASNSDNSNNNNNHSGDRSPVRKKTRFVTEKGIREAGRESLGTELSGSSAAAAAAAANNNNNNNNNKMRRRVVVEDNDDDEDELLIV